MKEEDLIEAMSKLVQVDIDAAHSYNQAIKEIDDEIIRRRLEDFRQDHLHHIVALSEVIQTMGGQPPDLSPDFKGFVIEAFATLSSFIGMKAALKALKATEEITNRYYGEIVSEEAPGSIKEMLRKHFSDEKIHLDYIRINMQALS
jgi:uncharacterized protein (TIGR02284 family)